jgi:serine phosphatase RsbU (regulator of sigma subunit)
LFCAGYGLRLLIDSDILGPLAGVPQGFGDAATAFLTYLLPIPGILFVLEWLGPGWKNSIRWMLYLQVTYAAIAVVIDTLRGAEAAMAPNNILVLLSLGLLVFNSLWARRNRPPDALPKTGRDRWIILAGSCVLIGLSINENLVNSQLVPWSWTYEPLGMLIFVIALGAVVAKRSVANDRRLAALSQELETARSIQTAILPRQMPDLPGVSVAARYLPMAEVGGDFFDFLPVDRVRAGFLIADVSGHGVPAALIASMVKIALASQADHAAEPAEVLAGMNRILHGKLERAFVTAAYAFVDTESGKVAIASAGHPPALIWRPAEKSVQEVRLESLPLGRFRQAEYRTMDLPFLPGDRLLLYTDGVVEAVRPGKEEGFGEERLKALLSSEAAQSPDRFADVLLDKLAAWTDTAAGSSLQDDVTVLVVERSGS